MLRLCVELGLSLVSYKWFVVPSTGSEPVAGSIQKVHELAAAVADWRATSTRQQLDPNASTAPYKFDASLHHQLTHHSSRWQTEDVKRLQQDRASCRCRPDIRSVWAEVCKNIHIGEPGHKYSFAPFSSYLSRNAYLQPRYSHLRALSACKRSWFRETERAKQNVRRARQVQQRSSNTSKGIPLPGTFGTTW